MDEEIKKEVTESEEENKGAISADLIRGHINTIILRTLYERDKYGYEIMTEIEEKSHGQYSLKQPTLYSALKRLESQGYINAYWKTDEVSNGGRRKYFTLTDSGREITEKNQSEWEYSRTVIDSLISDRNFDFSQPAPTSVDFKILKSSTSRVPLVKDGEAEKDETLNNGGNPTELQAEVYRQSVQETVIQEQPARQAVQQIDPEQPKEETSPQEQPVQQLEQPIVQEQAVQEIVHEQPITETVQQTVVQEQTAEQSVLEQPVLQQPVQHIIQEQPILQQTVQQVMQEQPVYQQPIQQVVQEQPVYQQPVQQAAYTPTAEQIAEERARHENYLRLISQPVDQGETVATNPTSERIDTEKLIYNIKPEPERDYKNLIDNLYVKTLRQQQPVVEVRQQPVAQTTAVREETERQEIPVQVNYERPEQNYSQISDSSAGTKKYTRGSAMLKSSLITAVILLVISALVFAFQANLGVAISYPIVIITIAVAQLMIFGIISTTAYGKIKRKPTNTSYITTTIVLAIISILIIFVTSLLLNVSFGNVGDVLAKIIIPSIVALNMPAFSCFFYLFSK